MKINFISKENATSLLIWIRITPFLEMRARKIVILNILSSFLHPNVKIPLIKNPLLISDVYNFVP